MKTVTAARPTREEKKAANRRRLLEAARELIIEKGYRATTLDDVAEQAGLTKGAVYSNFASKEHLLLAVLEVSAITFQPAPRPRDSRTGLGRAMRSITGAVARGSRRRAQDLLALAPLELELALAALRDDHIRDVLRAVEQRRRELTGAWLLAQAEAANEPLPAQPAELATLLQAVLRGLLQQRLLDPKAIPDRLFTLAGDLLSGRPVANTPK